MSLQNFLLFSGARGFKVHCRSSSSSNSNNNSIVFSPKKPRKNRPQFPPHSPEQWGVPPVQAPQQDEKQNVIHFLKNEGIFGKEVESLDLPLSIEVVKERMEFIRSLGLENTHILRYPLILTCSVKRNMVPVVDFIEKLGFTRDELRILLQKFPMVMYSSIAVDLKPVVDYLLGYGIAPEDLPRVLQRFPDILGFKLEGTMSTSVAYLVSIGVNTRQVGAMLTQFPELLGMKVGNNIKRKVEFFCNLGFTKQEMADLLEQHPYVLGYNLEAVKPRVDCLVAAGIEEKELPSMIARFPDIFELDLKEKLAGKIVWLTEKICVLPEKVPQVLQKLPQIIVINEAKALQKVDHLKEAGISAEDVGKMVVDCPQILAVKLEETLGPNLDFFREEMRRPLSELVAFPIYLTYNLKQRIQPRFVRIQKKKINCSLAWFLECTDDKFQRRLSVQYVNPPPPQSCERGSATDEDEAEESGDASESESSSDEEELGDCEDEVEADDSG